MQNNFSQEDDTSKVSSNAGKGCYGSTLRLILPSHLLFFNGAQRNTIMRDIWSEKDKEQSERHSIFEKKYNQEGY